MNNKFFLIFLVTLFIILAQFNLVSAKIIPLDLDNRNHIEFVTSEPVDPMVLSYTPSQLVNPSKTQSFKPGKLNRKKSNKEIRKKIKQFLKKRKRRKRDTFVNNFNLDSIPFCR